jgi:hypothetical protein
VVVSSTTRIRPDGKTVADLKNGVRVTAIVKDGTASGIVVHPA